VLLKWEAYFTDRKKIFSLLKNLVQNHFKKLSHNLTFWMVTFLLFLFVKVWDLKKSPFQNSLEKVKLLLHFFCLKILCCYFLHRLRILIIYPRGNKCIMQNSPSHPSKWSRGSTRPHLAVCSVLSLRAIINLFFALLFKMAKFDHTCF